MAYQWTSNERSVVKCLATGMSFPRDHRYYADIERDGIPILDPPVLPLDDLKRTLIEEIEHEAGQRRKAYLVDAFGKQMEYLEAAQQAIVVHKMGIDAANALPDHGRSEYPILAASVPLEAPTLFAAAELIMDRYERWSDVGADIKRDALAGRVAVLAATTHDEAMAARRAVQWSR